MTKTKRKYWIILISGFLMLLALHVWLPRPLNWMPSFSRNDKIPYGDYILYHVLPDIFPGQPIRANNLPLYDALKDSSFQHTNFIIVNNHFNPDDYATNLLLDYVKQGNNLFLSSAGVSGLLADTLHLKFEQSNFLENIYSNLKKDSLSAKLQAPGIFFTNPKISSDSLFHFPGKTAFYYSSFDSSRTTILAKDTKDEAVFIECKWGKGHVFLSANPLAFTNYNLLEPHNNRYIFIALSYLPVQKTIWDEYYKPGRREAGSPLRYILSRQELSWAYFLTLFTILLFVLFRGKRYQKIIPKFEPPLNSSREFIKTIGRLSLYKGNNLKIAQKRITLLNIYLRNRLNIKPDYKNPQLAEQLARVSGFSMDQAHSMIRALNRIQKQQNPLSANELISLNKIIDTFYKNTQR